MALAEPRAPVTPRRALPGWVAPVGLGAVGLAACLVVRSLDPSDDSNLYPVCPFRALTGGLDCPGCGATRATHALLSGHPGAAADHNLLFVLLLPAALIAYGVWLARGLGLRSAASVRLPRWWLPGLFGAIAAFWALRLLPGPFEWLASGRA